MSEPVIRESRCSKVRKFIVLVHQGLLAMQEEGNRGSCLCREFCVDLPLQIDLTNYSQLAQLRSTNAGSMSVNKGVDFHGLYPQSLTVINAINLPIMMPQTAVRNAAKHQLNRTLAALFKEQLRVYRVHQRERRQISKYLKLNLALWSQKDSSGDGGTGGAAGRERWQSVVAMEACTAPFVY